MGSGTVRREDMISGAQVRVRNPLNVKPVYANNYALASTNTDISVHFTQLLTTFGPMGSAVDHELKATVTMPIEIAAHLATMLADLVLAKQQERRAMALTTQDPVN